MINALRLSTGHYDGNKFGYLTQAERREAEKFSRTLAGPNLKFCPAIPFFGLLNLKIKIDRFQIIVIMKRKEELGNN